MPIESNCSSLACRHDLAIYRLPFLASSTMQNRWPLNPLGSTVDDLPQVASRLMNVARQRPIGARVYGALAKTAPTIPT